MGKHTLIQVGGRQIDITGFGPQQIQRVIDAAKNGAGSKASLALAKKITATLAAHNKKVNFYNKPLPGSSTGVNPETGQIDPNKATPTVTGAEENDALKNFLAGNPGYVKDEFGNIRKTKIDKAGNVTIDQKAGGPLAGATNAFNQAIGGYNTDFSSQVQGAQDANYNYITKDYQSQQAQETEAAKQELADRGIPFNMDPKSLYGSTLHQLDSKWQGLYDQAKNQAITLGNQTLQTQAGVQNQNINTLGGVTGNFRPSGPAYSSSAGQRDLSGQTLTLLQLLAQQAQGKYGIDKASADRQALIDLQKMQANQPQFNPGE